MADEAAHRAISTAIISDPAAHGPQSIAMEDRIAALEDQAQRQAGWHPKHRWLLWTLNVIAGSAAGAGVTAVIAAFGPTVTSFVATNGALLMQVAATYGGSFFNWFSAIMGPVLLALGVKSGLK